MSMQCIIFIVRLFGKGGVIFMLLFYAMLTEARLICFCRRLRDFVRLFVFDYVIGCILVKWPLFSLRHLRVCTCFVYWLCQCQVMNFFALCTVCLTRINFLTFSFTIIEDISFETAIILLYFC